MEYFSSLKSAFVGPSESQQTEAEIVEKLVERVTSSNSIDDRRDACRALRSLSKKYRVQVGAQGMEALLMILEQDRSDSEIITYALDALSNVICGIVDVDGELDYSAKVENIGSQFTEIYLKKVENVKLLLEILEDPDMQVKWACVKLLTALLINKPKEVQEYIISSPNGVSRLMDNLLERRDIIRNDTLFLLAHLTKGNANIQKIVAFQNAFDILFDIIGKEGYCDGGMVIEDALVVMCNLLKNNTSNQIFFKEGSFIQKLKNFFDLHLDLEGPDKGWHDQRRTNIILMLQVTRLLVSTNNPHHIISSCQKIMYQCGLLEKLCTLLMAAGVPVDVLTDTVVTVAEVIRGNLVNQEYFSTVNAPSSPPSPAIVVLLMSMMNDRQPFSLRCAVLFCFQSFLHKNELGQAQIVQTLLPSSPDDATATAGQFLCGGLFVSEPLSNWLASVALSHTLIDNITQKEQLLRVQLTTSMGKPPVYLLKHCSTILQQGGKPQMKIGLLILLCTWLSHCHVAVTQFLDIPINVPYLTSQIGINESDEYEILVQGMCSFLLGICVEFNDNTVASFKRHDLCQLIVKRVKLETFLNKLSSISKHESYCKAVQKPIIKFCEPSDLLFDYEFCNLFKSLEGVVISAVTPKPIDLAHGPECTMSPSQLSLLQEYKDVIRNQDQLLSSLNSEIGTLEVSKNKTSLSIQEMTNIIQQLRDQNALLKAHNAFSCGSGDNFSKHEELMKLKEEFEKLKHEYQTIQNEAAEKSCILEKLMLDVKSDVPEVDRKLQPTTDEFLKAIEEQNNEIQQLKHTIQDLESQLEVLKLQNDNYKALIEEKNEILVEYENAKDQLSLLQTEQEDLHIFIADQGTQISVYRHRLKELGEPVDEDAEDDLDLTEFEDNDEELFKKTT